YTINLYHESNVLVFYPIPSVPIVPSIKSYGVPLPNVVNIIIKATNIDTLAPIFHFLLRPIISFLKPSLKSLILSFNSLSIINPSSYFSRPSFLTVFIVDKKIKGLQNILLLQAPITKLKFYSRHYITFSLCTLKNIAV